ncbi:MAG: hypothetical protein CM1200mP41_11260 [Gammaproteobacteria bacterium]|nr:MAG: hypothetical protein CM1200mP41_11260 [Gammaproteobacteria bacterium]
MSDDEAGRIVVVRDMGLSHREFFRSLQPLEREWQCQIRDDGVLIHYDGVRLILFSGKRGGVKSLPFLYRELRFALVSVV